MKSLLDGVISQHIDVNGKTRVLNYKNISLAVSPLPVLDVPEVGIDTTIIAKIDTVLKFIEKKKLEVVEQHGEDGQIQGVWVKSLEKPSVIVFGYIPIEIPDNEEEKNELQGIPYSNEYVVDPLFVGEESQLDIMRRNEKIAEYLKQFALWEYSNSTAENKEDKFSINNFVTDESYKYDLRKVTFQFTRNNTFYRGKKIIVPDEDTAKRIVLYVKTSVFNDFSIPEKYKNKKFIDVANFFTRISDFRQEKNQIIFIGRESIMRWKLETTREISNSNVHSHSRPNNKEPYYYRNIFIKSGALMIIQNTKRKDLPSALAVSESWLRGVNIGYRPEVNKEQYQNMSKYFDVYTEKGITSKSNSKNQSQKDLSVFAYEDGTYAAMLFL